MNIQKIASEIACDKVLIDFLQEFVKKYDTLKTGHIYGCSKCEIDNLTSILSDGETIHPTPVRIQISKLPFYLQVNACIVHSKKIKGNKLLFCLLQCIAQNHSKISGDMSKADAVAIEILLKLGINIRKLQRLAIGAYPTFLNKEAEHWKKKALKKLTIKRQANGRQ